MRPHFRSDTEQKGWYISDSGMKSSHKGNCQSALSAAQAFSRPPAFGDRPAVLVATDRASRGIDAPGVGHVVLFDFPRDPSEYVRRAGACMLDFDSLK